jgi:DNA-directed RNA polymerase specialized sigma24 family protein
MRDGSSSSALGEFEQIYRGNVGAATSYFARRCTDPQTVADLTAETIVRAAAGFRGFDPRRGTARAWLLGIAGHVYAQYCAHTSNGRDAAPDKHLDGQAHLAGAAAGRRHQPRPGRGWRRRRARAWGERHLAGVRGDPQQRRHGHDLDQ